MEKRLRKSVSGDLKKFDYLAKDHDFVEVTEWANGEGYDICISDKKSVSLTCGELDAINYLAKTLDMSSENEFERK